MRSDVWDAEQEVVEVSGRMDIDGVQVPVSDLSVSREIPSNLPAQVAGVGGFTPATGSVTVSPSVTITDKSPTPWGAGSPKPLAPVTAYAKTGTTQVPVFTGMVDSTSGAASDPEVGVKLVDISDRLSRPVTVEPLCAIMPPPTRDGSTNQRNVDLISTFLVDRVLRECGFYATPPNIAYAVMSAPLQGSTWPEVGTVWSSNRGNTITQNPWWTDAPWGVASKGLSANYRPDLNKWSYAFDGSLSRAMEIVFCAGPTQNTSGRIACQWGTGGELGVSVTSSRSIIVHATFPSAPGERQTLLTAAPAQLGIDWRVATVRFTPVENGKMSVEVRTDKGAAPKRTGSSIPYGVGTQPMTNIECRWEDNAIGGVQVGYPGRAFAAVEHKPTAVLTPPVPFLSLNASPAIVNESAIDLLKQWSEAECAAMWIDEDGVFQWRNRSAFVSGALVRQLTSATDLLDLSWSHDIQGASARASVEYKTAGVQRTKRARIVVWEDSGQTIEPGDVMESIATTPDDEIWISVDMNLRTFQAETTKREFNQGQGSWAGYVAYDKDGNEHGNGEWVGYKATLQRLGWDAYKFTQTWDGHVPTGVDHLKLQTRDGGTALKPQWQGMSLPVLRAQCRVILADQQITATAGGPPNAPDLTHDASWWIQKTDQARSLAFWLAQQTAKPRPVVDGVEIMPDPRLQLGDKVQVCDPHRTGLRVTGVIIAIEQDITAGDHSMSLRLLVTDVLATNTTLLDYDMVFTGANLAVRDETWGTATLAQFDADPLKR